MRTDERKFLTVKEAAERYGSSKSTLDKLRMLRKGPAYHKVGARVVYAISDLDEWMEAQRRG